MPQKQHPFSKIAALYKNSSGHWNATVEGLAQNVLKMYMEYDLTLHDKCSTDYFKAEEENKKKIADVEEKWIKLKEEARSNFPNSVQG